MSTRALTTERDAGKGGGWLGLATLMAACATVAVGLWRLTGPPTMLASLPDWSHIQDVLTGSRLSDQDVITVATGIAWVVVTYLLLSIVVRLALGLTAMLTGVREGELIALQWGDIDWRGKFLEVRRADWSGHLGTPKNGKSRRIDLAEELMKELREHKKALAADAITKGKPMSEWVFPKKWYYPTKREERLRGDNLRRMLSTCLKKAGVRSVTFHQLRHNADSRIMPTRESRGRWDRRIPGI